jgi:hypothetical protein
MFTGQFFGQWSRYVKRIAIGDMRDGQMAPPGCDAVSLMADLLMHP